MSQADLVSHAEKIIGHAFRDRSLLTKALTHASVADSRVDSNERLEFLGDAVLGMVVCHELHDRYDHWCEGELTKVKSAVVSRRTCAEVADEVGLSQLLILGNGIENNERLPTSLRAAVFESIIGAVYLDGGLEAAQQFILASTLSHIERSAKSETHDNFKSVLQQLAQRQFAATPLYEALDEQGPDHSKCFEVSVVIGGRRFPSAWGPSKKQAEQEAAQIALDILQRSGGRESPPKH